MSLGDRDIEYIRLVAREAADEAIRHMTTNGFMPALREEARRVAEAHVTHHATNCPVATAARQEITNLENKMKLTMARIVIGVLLAGGAGGISSRMVTALIGGLSN